MKTKQILVIAIAMLFSFTTMSFSTTNVVNNTPPVKKSSKNAHHKKMIAYYFYFTDTMGNQYELYGIGGAGGGSLTSLVKACYDGNLYTSASVSGTYSVSGAYTTLSNVLISVPGGWLYSGSPEYVDVHDISEGPFNFTCGGGE